MRITKFSTSYKQRSDFERKKMTVIARRYGFPYDKLCNSVISYTVQGNFTICIIEFPLEHPDREESRIGVAKRNPKDVPDLCVGRWVAFSAALKE